MKQLLRHLLHQVYSDLPDWWVKAFGVSFLMAAYLFLDLAQAYRLTATKQEHYLAYACLDGCRVIGAAGLALLWGQRQVRAWKHAVWAWLALGTVLFGLLCFFSLPHPVPWRPAYPWQSHDARPQPPLPQP